MINRSGHGRAQRFSSDNVGDVFAAEQKSYFDVPQQSQTNPNPP
jgi:hypothetical protein